MDQLLNKVRRRLFWTVRLGVLVFALACPSASMSRTWYVRPDGTGSAPDIRVAVEDSAAAGDTVMVEAGTYFIEDPIHMKDGVVLTSRDGPFSTRLRPYMYPPVVIACEAFRSSHTEISGFWFDDFLATASGLGVVWISACRDLHVRGNVFTNNQDAIVMSDAIGANRAYIENNTMTGSRGLGFWGSYGGFVNNNIIWDRAYGVSAMSAAYRNDFMVLSDAGGFVSANFHADPEFCGPEAGNLYLQSDSPCAPGSSPWPGAGLIGAFPVNCGTVPTEERTWGAIKEMYGR